MLKGEYLVGILRGMIEILSSKSSQLASSRRQKNLSLAEFTAADIADFWLLYTVNAHFPVFNHMFAAKNGHPEELYAAMISLAGSLTTFSLKMHPRDLPLYDHDNLGEVFSDLDGKLRGLLETVVPTNVVSLPLKRVKNFIYATALSDEILCRRTHVSGDVRGHERRGLRKKAPQLLKMGSATQGNTWSTRRCQGCSLPMCPIPPAADSGKFESINHFIHQSGWRYLGRRSPVLRNMAAFVPGDLPNPELESTRSFFPEELPHKQSAVPISTASQSLV